MRLDGHEVVLRAVKFSMFGSAVVAHKHFELIHVILAFIFQLTVQLEVYRKIPQYFGETLKAQVVEQGVHGGNYFVAGSLICYEISVK